MTTKILIVEDEIPIREMIAFHLSRAGFATFEAGDCKQARAMIADAPPDLVVIDWMLPDMSGLELTRLIRRDSSNENIGIIMLTARAEERDKVAGLDSGADDYVTKPFSSKELISRIKSVLRRTSNPSDVSIQFGKLSLDVAAHRVSVDGKDVQLGPTEYRLLHFLMNHPERVYSRSQLLDQVWGANVYVEERTVDVHITRLRKSLLDFQVDSYIQTVRGVGYRFSVSSGKD